MFIINYSAKEPIYEQIKSQMLSLISSGAIKPGDKLPSIRMLASQLKINVNTIKKVFAQLEEDGVIVTVIGSGSYVAETAYRNPNVMEKAEARLREGIRTAISAGLTKTEILKIVSEEVKEKK